MKKFTIKVFTAVLFISALNVFGFQMRPNMLFTAKMDGAQETPSVSTSGAGVASFLLNYTRDSLCINITFSGLSGAATAAHIHGGATGVSGGPIVDLTPYIMGNRISATITGTVLTMMLKSDMLKGLTYVNVHTVANPTGEIRGQIWLESDASYVGAMDGAQESPSVTTTANGYAVFNLSQNQNSVKFYVVTDGLSGPITMAHIHTGAPGVSGGIIQDLSSFISGNTLSGAFTPSSNVVANLLAGTAYINVHTAANPGGEIRAQLVKDNKISFDAWMDGAQESPSVTTNAKGLANIKLNCMMDTLWYNVYTTGLSGAITGAHIHNGVVGVSGGIAVGFTTAVGNMLSGFVTGASLTTTLINNMLMGSTYVNVHTAANSGGEIRGQLYRVMREGYTISMDGNQEVPSVSTGALGSGFVSISRDLDNAHYMVVVNNITPTVAHFHKAVAGVSGGVINEISSVFSNNGYMGYWTTTDAAPFSPFSSMIAEQIDSDSIYVNVHTTANPTGEIRGQVLSGFKCYTQTIGINEINNISNGSVIYPNPAIDKFMLSFRSNSNEEVTVQVYDVIGNLILNSKANIHPGENMISVDMKNSKAGLYFVRLNNGKEKTVRKLIIE